MSLYIQIQIHILINKLETVLRRYIEKQVFERLDTNNIRLLNKRGCEYLQRILDSATKVPKSFFTKLF